MDKCKEKFETLEDYQTSIRVFNERTRLDYEDFINKQGQERQKLQLRFTPYTTKKGGYGASDLDHGLQIWQEQQKRIDELQARLDNLSVLICGDVIDILSCVEGHGDNSQLIEELEQALKGGEK